MGNLSSEPGSNRVNYQEGNLKMWLLIKCGYYIVNLSLCTCSERNDKPMATVGDPALSSAFASALHERRDFLKRSHVPIGTWILTCLVGYEIP